MKVRNLSISKKVGIIVALLSIFDIISYVIVFYNTNKNSDHAQVANVAGRNRFLSQRMTALADASLSDNPEIASKAKKELKETIHFFKKNLNTLINGGIAPKLKNTTISADINLSPCSSITRPALEDMRNFFVGTEKLYNTILNHPKYIQHTKYDVFLKKNRIITDLNPKVRKTQESLFKRLLEGKMLGKAQNIVNAFTEESEKKQASFLYIILSIAALNFIVIGIVYWMIYSYITKPIRNVQKVAKVIADGDFTTKLEINSTDEIGQVANSINTLIDNISNASEFANQIGKNELDTNYVSLGEKDTLGNSLLAMRDNLAEVADKESKRNWINEGLAKFTDIIRDVENVELFYHNVLSNLIRYVHANQGYLYVINEEENETYMEVKAVYAYGKQRYLEEKSKIYYQQGLVGQAWFDKEPLFFTEIPTDFVNITSGMGEATPTCVFIVPLIINEQVHGVIESASFEKLEAHKIEFINKLSETIASTVSNVKTNERTKYLLEQSQQQTEEMRAQEEEMNQNMEEMQATQTEMLKKEREMSYVMKKMQKQEAETEENLKALEKLQADLTIEQEKSKKKAQTFKQKMEDLDVELEGKKAELFASKKAIKELQEKLAKYES